MDTTRRASRGCGSTTPDSDPFADQPAFNGLRSSPPPPAPAGPQYHHAGATDQTDPVTGRRASVRETPTVSSRSSTSEFDDSHLDDLEKSLPIDTVPSLRLHTLQSCREQDLEKALDGGPAVQVKSAFDLDSEEDTPSPTGDSPRPPLSIRQRLAHFTWAWYTLTMSTGGLSLLIRAQPHQFPGLRQIGLVVYAINIALFVLVTAAQATRCVLFPGTFTRSLSHPREGFFFPTFFLSLATIITSTQRYCVPEDPEVARATVGGLLVVLQIAFWIYVAATTVLAIGQYSFVFAAHSFGLQTMMPTWILPIFPVMLSGTIASVIAASQPPAAGVPIVVAGLTCQGLGLAVAFLMYAHMVGRLMQSGLPHREHRTGLFMCVGPPAFTALAFIGLAHGLPEGFDHDMDGVLDTAMVETMGVVGAGFLWALSFWWFGIAVTAVIQSPPKDFHLGWWAAVFPNTGFTLATISLGSAFRSEPVLWFATVMSIALVVTFFFVLYHHVRAVIKQEIMYPGRDEDVEDH